MHFVIAMDCLSCAVEGLNTELMHWTDVK
jgi:hypothetical protein